MFKLEILQEAEKHVQIIRENLKIAQSRQKSYADNRIIELTFKVGDYVYLKVFPISGLIQGQGKVITSLYRPIPGPGKKMRGCISIGTTSVVAECA